MAKGRGVTGIGKEIGKLAPVGQTTGGTRARQTVEKKQRKLKTLADVPKDIRNAVAAIRKKYSGWGAQKYSIAAKGVINAYGNDPAKLYLVMATMLRNKKHDHLRQAIRKQAGL